MNGNMGGCRVLPSVSIFGCGHRGHRVRYMGNICWLLLIQAQWEMIAEMAQFWSNIVDKIVTVVFFESENY